MVSTAARRRSASALGSSATIWRMVMRGWCRTALPIARPPLSRVPSSRRDCMAISASWASVGSTSSPVATSSAITIATVSRVSTSSSV